MGQEDDYLRWKGTPAVGCAFARFLARRRNQFGQRLEVVDDSLPADIAAQIDTRVSKSIIDSNVDALTLVIPALTQLEALVEVTITLQNRPPWTVTRTVLPDTPGGPMVAFRLSHEVPLTGGTTIPSEALVLGSFEEFPATRRAPLTALEIYVGTPPLLNRENKPTQKANLDLISVTPPVLQMGISHMWETTEKLRSESLGGIQDCRAKAKVAFVIPVSLAQRLRCEP